MTKFTLPPELSCNSEGLAQHQFLLTFGGNSEIDAIKYRWRSWLVHCIQKSVRHYNEARETAIQQQRAMLPQERQRNPSTAYFPILNFSLAMEDCITSLFKAGTCMRSLAANEPAFSVYSEIYKTHFAKLKKIRDQQEHLFTQITSGQTGVGPIKIKLNSNGEIEFRNLRMHTQELFDLINGTFTAIASLFPHFNPNSEAVQPGVMGITLTATLEIIPIQPRVADNSE